MGSSSSKPARKLASNTAQRAAQVANSTPSTLSPSSSLIRPNSAKPQQQASETKTSAILQDASDPQFLKNLHKLGPVNVPKASTTFRPTDQMLNILAARTKELDQQAQLQQSQRGYDPAVTTSDATTIRFASPSSSRIPASSLSNLFDDRKHLKTQKHLETISIEYDLPLSTIEMLARHLTSPTVGGEVEDEGGVMAGGGGLTARARGEEDGPPKVKAVWVEPKIERGRIALSNSVESGA
ncbi:hypothetical protein IE53DRAFT_387897 [Violaceomyces palustris]|uniref:Uncharacterized protein n=1 Tax=Violaceomyces palustris TaxID=1673888 RepID=A0ACD0NVT9_9BASI|nr:hypothetical protein IE53DRAFT_387897 [Violaceomyces palustris]